MVPYYNDAGELLGWDVILDDPFDLADWEGTELDFEVPDLDCGCYSDQAKHSCDELNGEWIEE